MSSSDSFPDANSLMPHESDPGNTSVEKTAPGAAKIVAGEWNHAVRRFLNQTEAREGRRRVHATLLQMWNKWEKEEARARHALAKKVTIATLGFY